MPPTDLVDDTPSEPRAVRESDGQMSDVDRGKASAVAGSGAITGGLPRLSGIQVLLASTTTAVDFHDATPFVSLRARLQ